MKICIECKKIYNDNDYYCMKCNRPLSRYSDEENYQKQIEDRKAQNANKPKCPTCGSTNIRKISELRKTGGALMFGLLSTTARSQFECLNCTYKW